MNAQERGPRMIIIQHYSPDSTSDLSGSLHFPRSKSWKEYSSWSYLFEIISGKVSREWKSEIGRGRQAIANSLAGGLLLGITRFCSHWENPGTFQNYHRVGRATWIIYIPDSLLSMAEKYPKRGLLGVWVW